MNPNQLKSRLEAKYPGCPVEVSDLTGTENHYEVQIESPCFKGLTRIEQHQDVMSVFKPELATGELHALSIKTRIPKQ